MNQSSNPQGNLEEKSQLEEAITHLISDLPSVPASEDNPSPSPKAIILSPDTLPFTAQTNKVDIDKIDPSTVLQGKDDRIPMQESKEHEHTLGNNNSSSAEQCPISDSESMMNDVHNNHNNVQNADMSVQSNILANTRESNMNPCQSVSRHISRLDVSQNVNDLNAQVKIEQRDNVLSPDALRENDIKLKRGIETFNHQTQELVVQYFDDSASDSSVISQGIETHNRYMLKRVCSDEDLPVMHSKKRSNVDMLYASTNANDKQQCVSYVNCGTFATEDKYSAVKFNQYYDVNSQPLMITAESPNSSLDHEIETEFHQQLVDPAATNIDEEQYLRDLKNHIVQNSDLNPHSGKL